jgi:hypothetical protein
MLNIICKRNLSLKVLVLHLYTKETILLRGIQLTHFQTLLRFNCENDVFVKNILLSWGQYNCGGVRCAHFPSVITTIMDQKVELLKPLNLRELYAT